MSKINVLIAGSTGYIGTQLVKLLTKHKKINIKYLCGSSSVGKKISYFDSNINDKHLPKIIKFNKKLLNKVDVVFAALPNGETQKVSINRLQKYINQGYEVYPGSVIYVPRHVGKIDGINLYATIAPIFSSLALSIASLNSIND